MVILEVPHLEMIGIMPTDAEEVGLGKDLGSAIGIEDLGGLDLGRDHDNEGTGLDQEKEIEKRKGNARKREKRRRKERNVDYRQSKKII